MTRHMCESCATPAIAEFIRQQKSILSAATANQMYAEKSSIRDPYSNDVEKIEAQIRVKKRELNQASKSCKLCLYTITS